jgi:hypothetical protein
VAQDEEDTVIGSLNVTIDPAMGTGDDSVRCDPAGAQRSGRRGKTTNGPMPLENDGQTLEEAGYGCGVWRRGSLSVSSR